MRRWSAWSAARRAIPRWWLHARELVTQELDKRGSVEPTLLGVVVELAAVGGDASLYDRYLARSKAATEPEERYRYLYALTSFADPALVRRTMDLALSADVRSQDAKYVIARMLAADSQQLAWQLTRERWPEIQKKTGEFVGNTVIVGALALVLRCEGRRRDQGLLHHQQGPRRRTHAPAVPRTDHRLRRAWRSAQRPKLAAVAQGQ